MPLGAVSAMRRLDFRAVDWDDEIHPKAVCCTNAAAKSCTKSFVLDTIAIDLSRQISEFENRRKCAVTAAFWAHSACMLLVDGPTTNDICMRLSVRLG